MSAGERDKPQHGARFLPLPASPGDVSEEPFFVFDEAAMQRLIDCYAEIIVEKLFSEER